MTNLFPTLKQKHAVEWEQVCVFEILMLAPVPIPTPQLKSRHLQLPLFPVLPLYDKRPPVEGN